MGQPCVLVVTSCTGEKRSKPDNQLMLEDFKDSARLQKRHEELAEFVCPAGQMYTGVQHLRVMEGVQLLRQSFGRKAVDVAILSAAYGLIPEDKTIVPYEVTFNTMKGYEVDEWAKLLGIRQAFEQAIAEDKLVACQSIYYSCFLALILYMRSGQILPIGSGGMFVTTTKGLGIGMFYRKSWGELSHSLKQKSC